MSAPITTTFLYEGKAKKIYATLNPEHCIIDYKDETTAFNGVKKAILTGKGSLNNRISNALMQHLQEQGIATHFIQELGPTQTLVKRLDMFALEVVVRNLSAGSLAKRLGIKEGTPFKPAIVEFCYKNDSLGDPLINDDHAINLGLATKEELETLRARALKINALLGAYFKNLGIILVDFKLEFGKDKDAGIILGDEVSPDTCRLWDARTRQKLDKDRFRENLGGVCEAYEMVLEKIFHC